MLNKLIFINVKVTAIVRTELVIILPWDYIKLGSWSRKQRKSHLK